MKLLIGYDGSQMAEAALDDLAQAGLPDHGEAMVLTASEIWLEPGDVEHVLTPALDIPLDSLTIARIRKHWEKRHRGAGEAETMAHYAQNRFSLKFPFWKVRSEAAYGSPAREILSRAEDFETDLIVLGSHGRTAFGRFFLGSISQKVLTEAHCSVRIARGRNQTEPLGGTRVLIGFDGSTGADAAIQAVVSRFWREDSEARLVAVNDPITPSAIGRFVQPVADWVEDANRGERERLKILADGALRKLREAGLKAQLTIVSGNPKQLLVQEAARWGADSIFLGANRFGNGIRKCMLGSVASAVAARAHCSVEVVR